MQRRFIGALCTRLVVRYAVHDAPVPLYVNKLRGVVLHPTRRLALHRTHRVPHHVCKNSYFWGTRPGSRLTIVLRALTGSSSFCLAVRIIRVHHRDSAGVVPNPRIGVEDKRRFTQRTYVLFWWTRMGIRPAPSRVEIRREDVKRPSTAPGRAAHSPSRGLG